MIGNRCFINSRTSRVRHLTVSAAVGVEDKKTTSRAHMTSEVFAWPHRSRGPRPVSAVALDVVGRTVLPPSCTYGAAGRAATSLSMSFFTSFFVAGSSRPEARARLLLSSGTPSLLLSLLTPKTSPQTAAFPCFLR